MEHDPRFAQLYSRISDWQRVRGRELIEAADPRSGERVLDLGCGPGELTAELARRVGSGGRVIGIDPDPARIELAKVSFAAELPWLEFAVGRGEAMSGVAADSVDLVFSNYAIHWIREKGRLLDEVRRCLEPGGRIAFEVPTGPTELFEEVMALGTGSTGDPLVPLYFATEAEWHSLLRTRGFTVERSETFDNALPFASAETFYDWWEGTTHGSFRRSQIPEEDRSAFEATFEGGRTATIPAVRLLAGKSASRPSSSPTAR